MAEKEFKIQNGLRVLEEAYLESSLDVSGTVTANTFVGDGSGLTGLPSIPSLGSTNTNNLGAMLNVSVGYNYDQMSNPNQVILTPYGTIDDTALASFNTSVPGTTNFTLSYNNGANSTTFTKIGSAENIMGMQITIPVQYVSGDVMAGATDPTILYGTSNAGKFLTNDGSTVSWGTVPSGGVTLDGTESLTNKTITNSSFKGTLYDSMMTSGNQGMYLTSDGMGAFSWVNPPVLPSSGGIVPAEYIVRVDQDRTLTNNTTYQNIFDSGNNQITLIENTLYYVKGMIFSERSATASNALHQMKINFNGTAPQSSFITSIKFDSAYHALSGTNGSQTTGWNTAGGSDTMQMSVSASSGTALAWHILNFEGWIKTNESSTQNLTFTLQQSIAGSSSGPKIKANTYVILKPMTGIYSSATLVSGPWS